MSLPNFTERSALPAHSHGISRRWSVEITGDLRGAVAD